MQVAMGMKEVSNRRVSNILDHLLIGPEAMSRVDRYAAISGIDTLRLMENAGQAIAAVALKTYPGGLRFAVFCGPGNNGGDGYVAARALRQSGAFVEVFALGETHLKGDAKAARVAYEGLISPLESYEVTTGDVIIDAIFGAGLDRDVPENIARLIGRVNAAGLPVIAADVPSGIDGETGHVRGAAFMAVKTVTFMCRKPGHLLLPGRDHCGHVELFDIGIPERIVVSVADTVEAGQLHENTPEIWSEAFPRLGSASYKFSRGHLAVFSGGATSSGAARLSANAGLKAGAGAVTMISPGEALSVNACHLDAVMLKERTADVVAGLLDDARVTGFVIGPGFGVGDVLRDLALLLLAKPVVLDADAISSFGRDPECLFLALKAQGGHAVLTPHEGEFRRLFPDIASHDEWSKVEKTRAAAARADAVVIYKGADSVIAAPDGRAAINANAPSDLATAGSGDVLAGITGSLLAQGMPVFEAACAAVWLHGEAGRLAGRGLTAETLVDVIPAAIGSLRPFQDRG